MTDMINLSSTVIHESPQDIASWPATIPITSLNMSPIGGLVFSFDPWPPESWKWFGIGEGGDNVQYTVWAVVKTAGAWHAAGFVQMWQGRAMGDGTLPPILSGFVNWWGDVRHLWGVMSDYTPQAGDEAGFFVSAGNARLRGDVTSVRERSNVVLVKLPTNDRGFFEFGDQPTPVPVPPPVAHGYDEGQIHGFLDNAEASYDEANRPIDTGIGIWSARVQFDAVTIGYAASRAKHLAELRGALGLPRS